MTAGTSVCLSADRVRYPAKRMYVEAVIFGARLRLIGTACPLGFLTSDNESIVRNLFSCLKRRSASDIAGAMDRLWHPAELVGPPRRIVGLFRSPVPIPDYIR